MTPFSEILTHKALSHEMAPSDTSSAPTYKDRDSQEVGSFTIEPVSPSAYYTSTPLPPGAPRAPGTEMPPPRSSWTRPVPDDPLALLSRQQIIPNLMTPSPQTVWDKCHRIHPIDCPSPLLAALTVGCCCVGEESRIPQTTAVFIVGGVTDNIWPPLHRPRPWGLDPDGIAT